MNIIDKFRFTCAKVLPLVYDDSLSYYEVLCKVVDYLNKTIVNVNELSENFVILKQYVDDYFKGLPLEELIDAKLDEMLESGEFDYLANMVMRKADTQLVHGSVAITSDDKYNSWGHTVKLHDGTLLCIYNSSDVHTVSAGGKSIMACISRNGGLTWDNHSVIFNANDNFYYETYGCCVLSNGNLIMPVRVYEVGVGTHDIVYTSVNGFEWNEGMEFTIKGIGQTPFIDGSTGYVYMFRNVYRENGGQTERGLVISKSEDLGVNWTDHFIVNWTVASDYHNMPWECRGCVVKGVFVGMGRNENGNAYIMRSLDGVNWTYAVSNLTNSRYNPIGVCGYENNIILAWYNRSGGQVYSTICSVDSFYQSDNPFMNPSVIGFSNTYRNGAFNAGYCSPLVLVGSTIGVTMYTCRDYIPTDRTKGTAQMVMVYFDYSKLLTNKVDVHLFRNTNFLSAKSQSAGTSGVVINGYAFTSNGTVTPSIYQSLFWQRNSMRFTFDGSRKVAIYQPLYNLPHGNHTIRTRIDIGANTTIRPFVYYNGQRVELRSYITYETSGTKTFSFTFFNNVEENLNTAWYIGIEVEGTSTFTVYELQLTQGNCSVFVESAGALDEYFYRTYSQYVYNIIASRKNYVTFSFPTMFKTPVFSCKGENNIDSKVALYNTQTFVSNVNYMSSFTSRCGFVVFDADANTNNSRMNNVVLNANPEPLNLY